MTRLATLPLVLVTLVACGGETAPSAPASPAASTPEAPPAPERADPQTPDQTLMRVVAGEVSYRERIALHPGAIVTVTLEDQSKVGAPAKIIADYKHTVDGAPPYAFRFAVSPDLVPDGHRYGVRARIEHNDKLLFTSTEHIDPFAGAPGEKLQVWVQAPQ